jgi:nucleoside permease NupC
MPPQFVSLPGLIVLVGVAWLCPINWKIFPRRTVLWELGLRFFFALFILKTPIGALGRTASLIWRNPACGRCSAVCWLVI